MSLLIINKLISTNMRIIEVPNRIIDILPTYLKNYGGNRVIFSHKHKGDWISYSGERFNQLVDILSIYLINKGFEKGDHIAIMSNNNPEWNIIDFAVQQIGAIVIPIYPNISHNELSYIVEHSKAKMIFIENERLYQKYKNIVDNFIDTDNIFSIKDSIYDNSLSSIFASNDMSCLKILEQRRERIKAEDIATIIYTSGTSGIPKGVALTHVNIMSNINAYLNRFPVIKVALSYLPLTHILERSTQYSRIISGVSVYYNENIGTIMRDITDINPGSFSTVPRVIERVYSSIIKKVSSLKGLKKTMSMWAIDLATKYDVTEKNNGLIYNCKLHIAKALVLNKIKKSVLGNHIEFISIGGAAVQPMLVRFFTAIGAPLFEGYGLSETSPVISINGINAMKVGTVGKPCDNIDVKISEKDSEIMVKGPSVIKSYYNDDKLNEVSFTEDGYFRTGDRGYIDEDGFLVLSGRIKEIFKTSMGKYICPTAIENKLNESVWFNNTMVVGEYQKYAAALIVPNFEMIELYCKENDIEYINNQQIVKNKCVVRRYQQEIDMYNKSFGKSEQINSFIILDKEWTIDGGELTPSYKIKRDIIAEKYSEQIDSLF